MHGPKETERLPVLRGLLCPICEELFEDPVVAVDGFSYCRKCITEWFGMYDKHIGHRPNDGVGDPSLPLVSPATEFPLASRALLSNKALDGVLVSYAQAFPVWEQCDQERLQLRKRIAELENATHKGKLQGNSSNMNSIEPLTFGEPSAGIIDKMRAELNNKDRELRVATGELRFLRSQLEHLADENNKIDFPARRADGIVAPSDQGHSKDKTAQLHKQLEIMNSELADARSELNRSLASAHNEQARANALLQQMEHDVAKRSDASQHNDIKFQELDAELRRARNRMSSLTQEAADENQSAKHRQGQVQRADSELLSMRLALTRRNDELTVCSGQLSNFKDTAEFCEHELAQALSALDAGQGSDVPDFYIDKRRGGLNQPNFVEKLQQIEHALLEVHAALATAAVVSPTKDGEKMKLEAKKHKQELVASHRELEQLRAQAVSHVGTSREELRLKSAEVEALGHNLRLCNLEVSALRTQAEADAGTLHTRAAQILSLQKETQQSRDELSSKSKQLSTLKNDAKQKETAADNECRSFKEWKQEKIAQLEQYQAALKEKEAEAQSAVHTNTALREASDAVNLKLQRASSELESERMLFRTQEDAQMNHVRSSLNEAGSKSAKLEVELLQKGTELADAKSQLDILSLEVEHERTQSSTNSKELAATRVEASQLEQELRRYNHEMDNLQVRAEADAGSLRTRNHQLRTLQTELEEGKDKLAANARQISQLQTELHEKEASAHAVISANNLLLEEKKVADRELRKSRCDSDNLEELRRALSISGKKAAQLEVDAARKDAELQVLRKDAHHESGLVHELSAQLSRERAKPPSNILSDMYMGELQSKERELHSVKEELSTQRRSLKEQEKSLSTSNARCDSLRAERNQKDLDLLRLSADEVCEQEQAELQTRRADNATAELVHLQAEIEKLHCMEDVAKCQGQLLAAENTSKLQEELGRQELKLHECSEQLTCSHLQAGSMQARMNVLLDELEHQQARSESQESTTRNGKQELTKLRAELHSGEEERHKLNEKIQSQAALLSNLSPQVSKLQLEADQREKELQSANSELEDQVKNARSLSRDLHNEEAKHLRKNDDFQRRNTHALSQLETSLEAAQKRLLDAEREHDAEIRQCRHAMMRSEEEQCRYHQQAIHYEELTGAANLELASCMASKAQDSMEAERSLSVTGSSSPGKRSSSLGKREKKEKRDGKDKKEPSQKARPSVLWEAASLGDVDTVLALCAAGACVNEVDVDGRSPLHVACSTGHVNVVHALCRAGAQTDHPDNEGLTPLLAGAFQGDSKVVQALCHWTADVEQTDTDGWTPLFAAAYAGHAAVVQDLLLVRACPHHCASNNASPLQIAQAKEHHDVVDVLWEDSTAQGAKDPQALAPRPSTVATGFLFQAIRDNSFSRVRELCEHGGADINHYDQAGTTPLILACTLGAVDMVGCLCELRADMNKRSKDGRAAIVIASSEGNAAVVRTLCHASMNVDVKDAERMTPLLAASFFGHLDIINVLIDESADLDNPDPEGWTPLYAAAYSSHLSAAKLLLEAGADPYKATDHPKSEFTLQQLLDACDGAD